MSAFVVVRKPFGDLTSNGVALDRKTGIVYVLHADGENWTSAARLTPQTHEMVLRYPPADPVESDNTPNMRVTTQPTGPEVPLLLVQRTEAEWREEFNRKWYAGEFYPMTNSKEREQSWLAALALVGAIKEDAT